MKAPRIMLAAGRSGSGKTMITCGLLRALQQMGKQPAAFKCGPDYIDPMFHEQVIGAPSCNLDPFFTEEETTQYLFCKHAAGHDISVLEGVMGYYDGLGGISTKGSAYDLAGMTKTPVLLVVDAKGMSVSALAFIKGYLQYKEDSRIAGVIFNRMSEMLYREIAPMAEKELGISCVGFVPELKECHLESRHLGLVMPDEVENLQEQVNLLAETLQKTLDFEKILAIAEGAEELSGKMPEALRKVTESEAAAKVRAAKPILAVAKDEAFCFLYEDNLDYLRQSGCELTYFSPLKDSILPENIDGLLLYGGYPELHAEELSENISMRKDIAGRIQSGLPCIAECGGFLYLHEYLETPDKEKYPMAGIIRGTGYNAGKLQRFGYMSVKSVKNTMLADKNQSFRAHEFHYWNSDCPGSDYEVIKASDNSTASAGYGSDTLYAGFPHIYFYGNENVAERFMDACMKYKKNSRQEAELIPELDKIKGINRDAVMKAKAHWNGIAKPLHGLGLMEEIITQIAGIQNTVDVHIDKRAVIVMCADNGIVEEGITQTGQDVTAVVSCNMADGISSVCRMAACSKTDVIPVNIGIAADKLADGTDVGTYKDLVNRRVMTGTRNFLKEPAMSQEQLIQAVHEGIKQVEWCSEQGYNILATGEMGIGNTTTSTALASILLNLEPEAVTGRGAGLDDSGLKRKVEVIAKAKEMYGRYADNPLKLLQSIGGLDIAGLVGVYIGGAVYGIPVVADGVIATVAALIAVKLQPEINDYIIVSHQGKEPAMKVLLDSLGKKAVIHAELALGEGTGAVMMFPLLDMALQVYRENTTFDDIQIAAYEDYGKC